MRSPTRPTTTPSGSGPLSSLRVSKVSVDCPATVPAELLLWFALNACGGSSPARTLPAMMRSKSFALSNT
ncbi:MAG: hypothetical protein MUE62_13610, partial [Burkholderiaceae bacterium]|nr:hypothetical protein [Burkholderiaceae bacterium]